MAAIAYELNTGRVFDHANLDFSEEIIDFTYSLKDFILEALNPRPPRMHFDFFDRHERRQPVDTGPISFTQKTHNFITTPADQ